MCAFVKNKRIHILWLLLSVLVIALDQISKFWIKTHLIYLKPYSICPHFNLFFIYNRGAAFGFLNHIHWGPYFFIALAIFMVGFLMVWLFKLNPCRSLIAGALCLIIGGAISNALDRILFGVVVDFLDFYWQNAHFATFNVADSAISVGGALLILDLLLDKGAGHDH